MTYFISRLIYRAILKLFFGFEVIGRENVPRRGPFIMAANHVSYADPVVIGVACHTLPITFMAKRELFKKPILGAWCKAVGCIPIERHSGGSPASLKKSIEKLRQGGALGIFPEGRRSVDGRLQKAEAGVGLITLKSGAPVIPVYISGTNKALPIGKRWPKPCRITARIGNAVDIDITKDFSERKELYEHVGEKIIDAISRLKDEK